MLATMPAKKCIEYCWLVELLLWISLMKTFECLTLEEFTANVCLKFDDDVVKYTIPYHQCTDMCKGRHDCRATSYWPKMAMCRMHMRTNGTVYQESCCLFSNKTTWSERNIPGCNTASCQAGMLCRVECERPVCYEQDCPAITPLKHGTILGNSPVVGSQLLYQCDKWYWLTGSGNRTCELGGWSGVEPVCNDCPAITPLKHGTIFGNSTLVGSQLLYQCDKGFWLTGSGTRTCEVGGWSGVEPVCNEYEYLVSGPNGIPDDQLSASTVWDSHYNGLNSLFSPKYARLDTASGGVMGKGCWTRHQDDTQPWIQAKFSNTKLIIATALQGRDDDLQYATQYKVKSSVGCEQFYVVKDGNGNEQVFDGNTDSNTIVIRYLPTEITATCVRIYPTASNSHPSLRFDVLGRNP